MKFSDIIEDGKFIQIKRQRVKKLNSNGELKEFTFVEHAKSRSRKKPVYIPTDGQRILSLVKESNALKGDGADGFVFYNQHNHMTTATLDRLLETACNKTGIPVRRMHCIRKTYGTKLADNHTATPIISAASGHSNIKTTLDHYSKDRTTLEQQVNSIEPLLGNSILQGTLGNTMSTQ